MTSSSLIEVKLCLGLIREHFKWLDVSFWQIKKKTLIIKVNKMETWSFSVISTNDV